MTLQPARFSIDTIGDDVLLDGFTNGETWNGWDCPYFTFEQAQIVIAAFNAADRFEGDKVDASYDAKRDTFSFFFESAGESDEFPAVEIEGQKFYPIGAGCWVWESEGKWEKEQDTGADAV